MRVWRIEHDCEDGHGPASLKACTKINLSDMASFNAVYKSKPDYGFRHDPPQCDPLLRDMVVEERVGTLPHQFPEWWSAAGEPDELPDGWLAIEYEVPDEFVRVGEHQVCFIREVATRVTVTSHAFPREVQHSLFAGV